MKLCYNVFDKFRKKTSNLLKHIESVCTLTGSEFLLISYIKVNKLGPYKGEQDKETKFVLKRQRKHFHCHLFLEASSTFSNIKNVAFIFLIVKSNAVEFEFFI